MAEKIKGKIRGKISHAVQSLASLKLLKRSKERLGLFTAGIFSFQQGAYSGFNRACPALLPDMPVTGLLMLCRSFIDPVQGRILVGFSSALLRL